MSGHQIETQIRKKEFAPLYLLYGEESYLSLHYARALFAAAVPTMREFNQHHFTTDNFSLEAFAAAIEHLPMMAERTCVLLQDLDPDAFSPTEWKTYQKLLSTASPDCVLLLLFAHVPYNRKSARWKALIALAKKQGQEERFSIPTHRDLERWLGKCAKAAQASITVEAAGALIEACASDMERMRLEIEKLAAYAPDGKIDKQTVAELVPQTVENSIYDLSRAVTAGRLPEAFRILDQLAEQKEEPVVVLSALSQTFVDLYRAAVALEAGEGPAVLAADFPYRGKEFRIRNALRECRGTSPVYLRQALALLLQADGNLKSNHTDSWLILERLCLALHQLKARGNAD